ncbi:MAG: peptide chain release factor N(5)-glutamine methyltransferase [Mariniblastus sp.]|nr:peptide chain release factor N(5)-glutamine methyltransferase [Mariniblastus sp.]
MNLEPQSTEPPEKEPWTIKRLLDWTAEHFEKRDTDNPRLRAEVLLAEALDCPRIELYTQFATVPSGDSLKNFRSWVKRHAAGEPVAYLVGSKEFYSLKFSVDTNVLIPRPETEHVIIEAIEAVKSLGLSVPRIADVGTGSGCIAVTLATQLPASQICAIDLSRAALDVAQRNANDHNVGANIQIIESDLFAEVPDQQFDLVVSNPPYIGTAEQNTVADSVRDFEPHVALFAGQEGMDVIRRLVASSVERLSENGYLIVEISPFILERCQALIRETSGLEWVKLVNDYSGHARVLVARRVMG